MHCEEQEELRRRAASILQRIDQLTEQEIEAVRNRRDDEMLALDKQIEEAVGEKERTFGALLHHREQHGC